MVNDKVFRSTGYTTGRMYLWSEAVMIKSKAIPVQAWTGHEGSKRLRPSEFLDSRHMEVASLLAQRTSRLYLA